MPRSRRYKQTTRGLQRGKKMNWKKKKSFEQELCQTGCCWQKAKSFHLKLKVKIKARGKGLRREVTARPVMPEQTPFIPTVLLPGGSQDPSHSPWGSAARSTPGTRPHPPLSTRESGPSPQLTQAFFLLGSASPSQALYFLSSIPPTPPPQYLLTIYQEKLFLVGM